MKRWLLCLLLSVVVGCGPAAPTLDTTTDESLMKSAEVMSEKLSDQDKIKLMLTISSHMLGKLPEAIRAGRNTASHELCKDWHGLTADQIFAKGNAEAAEKKETNPFANQP